MSVKISKKKLEIAMARKRVTTAGLTEAARLPRPTINNAICGRSVRPVTLGKIAQALGVDPVELLKDEA